MRPCRGVLHTPPYRSQRKRADVFRLRVYSFIPCGMFVGRMQYAPTTVRAFDRWVVRVFLGRCVLHTPLDHTQRKRTIIWEFMGYTIIPCGMIMGRMQYAPTRVRVFERWVVRVFLGRGVLHTPLYHTQRKRTIIWGFMVYAIIPCGMFVGRMQYAPTQAHLYLPSIKFAYPCRGVLHTPHKHPVRDECIDLKSENVHPFPLDTIEGRMQYAPTQTYLYHPSIKYAYLCRGVLHTPHNHPVRDECIDLKSENVHPFPLDTIEGRMKNAYT